jgi:hypothetical protein
MTYLLRPPTTVLAVLIGALVACAGPLAASVYRYDIELTPFTSVSGLYPEGSRISGTFSISSEAVWRLAYVDYYEDDDEGNPVGPVYAVSSELYALELGGVSFSDGVNHTSSVTIDGWIEGSPNDFWIRLGGVRALHEHGEFSFDLYHNQIIQHYWAFMEKDGLRSEASSEFLEAGVLRFNQTVVTVIPLPAGGALLASALVLLKMRRRSQA